VAISVATPETQGGMLSPINGIAGTATGSHNRCRVVTTLSRRALISAAVRQQQLQMQQTSGEWLGQPFVVENRPGPVGAQQ